MNIYSSQRKTNPYPSIITLNDKMNNQFNASFLNSLSPKTQSKFLSSSYNKYNTSYKKNNVYFTTMNNIKNDDARLGEIKMNLDILNDKLNKLKNIMNDNPLSSKKTYNGNISYRQRSSNNQIKSSLYNGLNGRNINQNTSFDAFDNNVIDFDNNTNIAIEKKREGTLVQSPINFEIKTPIKNVTLHEKDITSTNLSQIADDLVSTLEIENMQQTHVDNLKSLNEINFTVDNKLPPKENTLSISSSVVNIEYENKKMKTLNEIIEKEEEKQTPVKDENDSENEDDLIIQEIMKKVQEDNEKAKQKHIAFNTKDNIQINYKDTNEITNFQVINEESKEKIVVTPRKMHLYTQILKSKSKPKSAIKPFNCKDIKINEDYNPDDIDDYEEEEESEENKDEEGNTINNIRNMFNKEETEEAKEEDVEEYKENRRQYSS